MTTIATYQSNATRTKAVVLGLPNGNLAVNVYCTVTGFKNYGIGFSADREMDAVAFALRVTGYTEPVAYADED